MTNQLLAELEMANRQLEEKDKEIERLNNIINELEKWLIDEYSKYNGAIRIADILDKLKELKLLSKMYRLNDRIEKDIKEFKGGK